MIKIPEQKELWDTLDGKPLHEVLAIVQQMISEFGPDAELELDAGHNNVSLIVHYSRDETPEEVAAREAAEQKRRENEREALLRKKRAIDKKLRELGDID